MDGSLTTTISDTKSNKKLIKIKSVSADGAYDSNRNFQYLQEKGITPGIKVRSNSIVSPKKQQFKEQGSLPTIKGSVEMEKEKKVWTQMDC